MAFFISATVYLYEYRYLHNNNNNIYASQYTALVNPILVHDRGKIAIRKTHGTAYLFTFDLPAGRAQYGLGPDEINNIIMTLYIYNKYIK